MRLKIKTKIIIIFAILISLLCITSIIGVTGMNSIKNMYSEVMNKNIPVETLVKEVRSLNLEQVAAVRGYIIYKDETYSTLFNDINGKIDITFTEIEKRMASKESLDYLNKVKEEHESYQNGCNEIFSLVKQDKMEEAIARGEEMRIHVTTIKEITDNWSKWVSDLNINIIHNVDDSIRMKFISLFAIVFISILISLIAGLYIIRNIAKPIISLTKAAAIISEGDLSNEIPKAKTKDEISDLSDSFGIMAQNLRQLIISINDVSQELVASSEELSASSEEVTKASEQVAISINDLAKGASDQSVSTEKSNSKILHIINAFSKIANDMVTSDKLTEQARETVRIGEEAVKFQEEKVNENLHISLQVSSSITELSKQSKEIEQILDVIHDIAEQTNLLALNAAIEAARAGDAGKGFSVVAEEIRKLAEQSRNSVQQISSIIDEVQTSVNESVNHISSSEKSALEQTDALKETIKVFHDISTTVNDIAHNIRQVSDQSNVLNKDAIQAGDAIAEIASISQEIAASSEELASTSEEQASTNEQVAASAENLTKLAEQLQNNIIKFKI
ncbi:methyl-accepting chemotaxis protein [Mobilisporobacter senegalensis]|uniref:Methyl-accepting chemotaxis protein n=1 Tax=Mobilisporobacter senegalensis TaxID=1329262 RepID=A0A3N1XP75_9FIRM|nr:methyl-accepting chemotaxis protein [Mobilisporobacter senegalensis]ROR28484.1 methyl-accepting chemotaxis protein [Mobilisporobacter senegalensis]